MTLTISLKPSHVADDVMLWMICRDHAGVSGVVERTDVLAVYPEGQREAATDHAIRAGCSERLAVIEFHANGDRVCHDEPIATLADSRVGTMA